MGLTEFPHRSIPWNLEQGNGVKVGKHDLMTFSAFIQLPIILEQGALSFCKIALVSDVARLLQKGYYLAEKHAKVFFRPSNFISPFCLHSRL